VCARARAHLEHARPALLVRGRNSSGILAAMLQRRERVNEQRRDVLIAQDNARDAAHFGRARASLSVGVSKT